MPFDQISRYIQKHSIIYITCDFNASNDIQLSILHGEMKPQRVEDEALMSIAIKVYNLTADIRSMQNFGHN